MIPKDNFATSNINQFKVGTSVKGPKVSSIIPKEMKGGTTMEEVHVEQEDVHSIKTN